MHFDVAFQSWVWFNMAGKSQIASWIRALSSWLGEARPDYMQTHRNSTRSAKPSKVLLRKGTANDRQTITSQHCIAATKQGLTLETALEEELGKPQYDLHGNRVKNESLSLVQAAERRTWPTDSKSWQDLQDYCKCSPCSTRISTDFNQPYLPESRLRWWEQTQHPETSWHPQSPRLKKHCSPIHANNQVWQKHATEACNQKRENFLKSRISF